MTQKLIQFQLSADLVAGGNVSVSYPQGTGKGTYSPSMKHKFATVAGNIFRFPYDFTLTFNATTVQVNWTVGSPTIPAGTNVILQLDMPGKNADRSLSPLKLIDNFTRLGLFQYECSMGSASATAICAAQAIGGAVNALINGGQAVNGAWTADHPRNTQVVSSGAGDTTQTVTLTGVDVYGVAMVETIALNGVTPVLGKKAFAKVTKVAVSAALAGNLSVGSSTGFGLPFVLSQAGNVIKEIVDGATVTNGVFVAASAAKPTATAADVRGLYTPNTASDGTHTYELQVTVEEPEFQGLDQFAG